MSLENIKKRAEYLAKIRNFFKDLDVLEVDTPLAYDYAVTDPFIDVFSINTVAGKKYLQSSPEYAMKRLLAAGSGSIYQICKAFRDEPCGKLHNHEFTMIEWYRVGIDYYQLMQEMQKLFTMLKANLEFIYLSYQEVFEKYYNINPHDICLAELQAIVKENVGEIQGLRNPTIADCLDILFSYKIEKNLNQQNTIYFIYDYTIHQSALSRKVRDKNSQLVAARFEVFCNGIELANGYYELIDKKEQSKRFENDLVTRKQQQKALLDIDTKLLECLENIPECSGVALGFDRLLMSLEGISNIKNLTILD
ncbi:EF-P lysine aminoacylase GenX [Francisella tularensis]|uniref:EF-P lysine aminoacylase GenX n=2 Tax=Francisella tularensis subsp. holarctica TaxID=119857 RepID=A0AAI8FTG7_FRATH|nr:EF-P lysine aminoacylase EpmA [Francisella tularensis]AFX71206.1 lysyl-tRNA synthetase [Francisella tularensis subsp. holarctica F92]EBA53044.1 lysyl-tRNA synthetase [Francisella tularensis subsp. holarctica 257]ABI83331.1 lysine--tRNA ligase [Francisella tularensis subsp. holarctica OSU18]ABU62147.1 tRNA synthetases class II protein [Francisella tularensis subsp. holarctica FTNF002-00]AFT93216.1 tRNA synthetase class II (D, K and N) [Francisella tularensis subsp. holarctica FSC200]